MLPKLDGIIKKHISLLHSDDALKILFLSDLFYTIYKRNKNLKKNLLHHLLDAKK